MDKPTLEDEIRECDEYGIDFLDWLEKQKEFKRIFDNKEKRGVLLAIFTRISNEINFHTDEDTNPHQETLAQGINENESDIKNHRHDLTKCFSAKAET